ncbi:MAG: lipoprotein signal peptidase [Muribaculaceae bacterium]|nr:lipoprotein signal peptidase [Muribaculaceae bacterium]MBQ2484191.1 lipoprotein signal peptidase [Muribaculaceae bacterium]MBQ4005968.1 lipoprotein signal peptidase [Muribaculaceae bacterium]
MNKPNNGTLALAIVVMVIAIDQALKIWVKTHFFYGEALDITPWFKLQFIENNGMAFGMELGSKLLLTWFRIIAVVLFGYYLWRIRQRDDLPRGYVVCIAAITAGAAANVIDCIAYGLLFDAPPPPLVAQLLPPDGGYGTLFHGRVVDMLYFPLCEWNWPQWMPWVGGEHFIFFQPIFNVADAALSVSVIVLILFYSRQLAANENGDTPTPSNDDDDTTAATT